MTEEFNWLDEADEQQLLKKLNEDVKKVIDIAVEEAERKFKERNIDPQEHEDLFKDYVKEYVDILSNAYLDDVEEAALKQVDKNKKQIREYLPNIDIFKYSNTKVENVLMKPETNLVEIINSGSFEIDIAGWNDKKKEKKYVIKTKMSALGNEITLEGYEYAQFIRSIVSMVGNAYDDEELKTQKAGYKTIRVDHLINLINGDDATTDVRPEVVDRLVKELEPLTSIRLEIDAEAHARYNSEKKKKFQLERSNYKGFLLPVEFEEIKEFSKSKQTYMHILKRPVLYEYADDTGQFIKVSKQALNLTKNYLENGTEETTVIKRMTRQRVVIRDYINGEIYGRGRNNTDKPVPIKYESISKAVEKDEGKKVRKQTLNKNIESVIRAMEQKNDIRKFEIIQKGRTKLYRLDIYHVIDKK